MRYPSLAGRLSVLLMLTGCAPPTPQELRGNYIVAVFIAFPSIYLVLWQLCWLRSKLSRNAPILPCSCIVGIFVSAFGLMALLIGDPPPGLRDIVRQLAFCLYGGAFLVFLTLLARIPSRWSAMLDRRREHATQRAEAKARDALLRHTEQKNREQAAAREKTLQQMDASRVRAVAVALLNDLLLAATELDGGSDDRSILGEMLRTAGVLVTDDAVARSIQLTPALKQDLREVLDRLSQAGHETSPVYKRLSAVRGRT